MYLGFKHPGVTQPVLIHPLAFPPCHWGLMHVSFGQRGQRECSVVYSPDVLDFDS